MKDTHGSVVGYYNANGERMTQYEYDAFGNILKGSDPDPFGYCGEYYDSESGNIYLRARYYNSETGRFISEDPAKDGVNWYVYCSGNPVMFVDSLGLEEVPVSVGIDTFLFRNMEEKETGYYCDLRAIVGVVDVIRPDTTYLNSQVSDGKLMVSIGFQNGEDQYTIALNFDSMEAGTYASQIRIYKNSLETWDSQVGADDRIATTLREQSAYFFLDYGENGANGVDDSHNIRVQCKVSTMFSIMESSSMGELVIDSYELAKNISYNENITLQDALYEVHDRMFNVDISPPSNDIEAMDAIINLPEYNFY